MIPGSLFNPQIFYRLQYESLVTKQYYNSFILCIMVEEMRLSITHCLHDAVHCLFLITKICSNWCNKKNTTSETKLVNYPNTHSVNKSLRAEFQSPSTSLLAGNSTVYTMVTFLVSSGFSSTFHSTLFWEFRCGFGGWAPGFCLGMLGSTRVTCSMERV